MGLFKDFGSRARLTPTEVPYVTAVIVAAGKSERLGKDKQFLSLCGIGTIARTLSAFEKSRLVRDVIIVTNKFDLVKMEETVREFGFDKVVRIVTGGETRQQSAARGVRSANPKTEFFAVHDGARPLVTPACIDKIINGAVENGSAAAAVRVKDTIKIANENGLVMSTPNRQHLWTVQTPQVFGAEMYLGALEKAEKDGNDYTDDCQLIEAAGGEVRLIEGEYTNIKITTEEDVILAEAIIKARGEAF